jgi:hypothetical protein
MAIDKSGKILAQFNVKNGQYKTASGSLSSLTWLTKVSLDKNLSTQAIYGDGELQLNLINDKGYTGTIGMTARDIEFETALGMQMELDGGLAEIQQTAAVPISLYFETNFVGADGVVKTKKVWLFGVEVSAPSEALDQNTDDPAIATVEYGITVKGTYLKDTDGETDYIDTTTGNKVKVFKLSSIPTDTGFDSFGDTVPVPTAKTEEPDEEPEIPPEEEGGGGGT